MSELILHRAAPRSQAIALPEPRVPISIRQAVLGGADLMFIDQLQKKHNTMVGFMPRMQLEAYIRNGRVLVAEDPGTTERVGYIIFHDKYLKREELGIVYHLNVAPGRQRGLVGASLVKAAFERSAYGCKLFCCWCAQDLEANHFWESLGFVPLAFRTGARKAGSKAEPRIHIFWQRRIREGDAGPASAGGGGTPYWFPSETTGGAMREARIVLPIPPGTHWSDAKPAVFPGVPGIENVNALPPGSEYEAHTQPRTRERKPKPAPPIRPRRGLWFAPPAPPPLSAEEKKAAKAKERKQCPRLKNDPKLVAAARELRDRYIEQINQGLLLPPSACGKYDVSRQLAPGAAPSDLKLKPLLAGSGATGKLAA